MRSSISTTNEDLGIYKSDDTSSNKLTNVFGSRDLNHACSRILLTFYLAFSLLFRVWFSEDDLIANLEDHFLHQRLVQSLDC